MTINLHDKNLSEQERQGVERLLESQNPHITDDLEQIWYLLDKTWRDMGCDNARLNWQTIAKFYAHPVWLLNGLFIETHEVSMQIRQHIASYIRKQNFQYICDYGGGFGTLAREIARVCPDVRIDIYEPFPSQYGKKCIEAFHNIHFVSELKKEQYDCLISTDVLEHVDHVLDTFNTMLESLKIGGQALIGNCFYPVIECHLPKHFHFRYTFTYIATLMGVTHLGKIEGADYVQIYYKSKPTRVNLAARVTGGGSRCLYPLLNMARFVLRPCVKILRTLKNRKDTQ